MAQWQQLLKLDSAHQDQVSQVYHEKFPREIRHYLSDWIESQNWDLAADNETEARNAFWNLLRHLDEQQKRCVQQNNILLGPDFLMMKSYLQQFREDPLSLAMIVSECLKQEKKILAKVAEAQGYIPDNPAMERQNTLANKISELREQTWETEREIKSLEDLRDKLDHISKTQPNKVDQVNGSVQSQALAKEEFLQEANFFTLTKQLVLQQIMKNLNLARQIVSVLVTVELPEWKHRQQMACIGSPADTSLDLLQMWFTTVGEVLQQMRQQLKKLQEQDQNYTFNGAFNGASSFLNLTEVEELTVCQFRRLLENALVVEKQPCSSSLSNRSLILKTGVLFSVKIRFLVNLPEFKCMLKVKPVFDKDVAEKDSIKGFRQFAFVTNKPKVLDVEMSGGGLVAEFGHLSLKDCKVRGKRSYETPLVVTEELHVIKFETQLQQGGLDVDIQTSSLPLVIVSSSNQVPSAWASVLWCSMLTSEPQNLSLFVSPPPVTWQQLSEVLHWQFLSVCERGLNEIHLSMLKDKLVDNSDDLVHWGKFCKNEGVWFWIHGILDLIKKHLLDLWKEGSVMGFVSKGQTETLLRQKMNGTFLLRFSESSRDGAITFSWVEHNSGETHVHAVLPYTKKELSNEWLPNIIKGYSVRDSENTHRNPLLYLYPDIPKDSAFGKHYSKPELLKRGYWGRKTIHVSKKVEIDMDTGMEWGMS
ncbi:signal transducer and activator of transcription 1-alpha/beta-like isoform X2 [Myripristis murdjan]|uniref:signal transducer and activator of transcription 1-alpha/beta-like isoform X2 n=1 Tax=Myripristis murdjan TaxID=586833 RepID=UPI001175CD70|nr:signal transducer and activator of transcription 1-alpha/beta-like isoform X2 [Myripristis murdjan]